MLFKLACESLAIRRQVLAICC